MACWIALIRGINVGGHQKLAMADLRRMLAEMGFANPVSLLQSGNLLFHSPQRSAAKLEKLLEAQTSERLGMDVGFLLRSLPQWEQIVEANPFVSHAERDPGRLVVMCLKQTPAETRLAALQKAITGREFFRAVGPQLYIVYPDGIGRSRLTHGLIERTLGARGTARNWNTVVKIAEAAKGMC
jgi:uncharacterized protein (DUF1697 family)